MINNDAIKSETNRLKTHNEVRKFYIGEDIEALGDMAEGLSDKDKSELAALILEELDRNEDYLEIYWSIVRTVARSYIKRRRLGS